MVKNPEVQKTKAIVIRPKKVKDPHRIIHILTNISPIIRKSMQESVRKKVVA